MNGHMMNMHNYLREGKLYQLNTNSNSSSNQQQNSLNLNHPVQQQIQMSTSRDQAYTSLQGYQPTPSQNQIRSGQLSRQMQQFMYMKQNMSAVVCGAIFSCLTGIFALAIFYFYLFDYVKDYIPYFNTKTDLLTQQNAAAYFKQHQLIAGEIHYARIPFQYWEHRIQMIKSMGMNTLSVYVFWNYHQLQKEKFDFRTKNKNLAAFLQLAQAYNMTVLLRPGPYVCAQWDFGGLPARLLSTEGLEIRSSNQLFLNQVKIYLEQLSKVIKPYVRTKNNPLAPILMIQIENQPGYFTEQKLYIQKLKNIFDQLNLQCPFYYDDNYKRLQNNPMYWQNAILGINDPYYKKKNFYAIQNSQNYVIGGEIYGGWFSEWGQNDQLPKIRRNIYKEIFFKQFSDLLEEGRSFSMYMVHGGTNFGLTAGYNMLTSYDYQAPINQQGLPTQKFHTFRTIKLLQDKASLPNIPKPIPTISQSIIIGNTKYVSSLLQNLVQPLEFPSDKNPLLFQSNQLQMFNQGIVIYQTVVKGPKNYLYNFIVHDIGIVYLDGIKIGDFIRKYKTTQQQNQNMHKLNVNCEKKQCKLQIIIQALGHVNFGKQMKNDKKGLLKFIDINNPSFNDEWKYFRFNVDLQPQWKNSQKCESAPCLYYVQMNIDEPKDMYIQPLGLKKGYIWVNGYNLGRYWNIGPQHRLYCPGVWLNKGKNKLLILDMYVTQQNHTIKAEKELA